MIDWGINVVYDMCPPAPEASLGSRAHSVSSPGVGLIPGAPCIPPHGSGPVSTQEAEHANILNGGIQRCLLFEFPFPSMAADAFARKSGKQTAAQ